MDLSDNLINSVKGFEGFTPRAHKDYKQTSIGHGTKALPGQTTITREQADLALRAELAKHAAMVDAAAQRYGLHLAPTQRDALVSFDYNTGSGPRLLERAGGDLSKIPALMGEYVNVTEADGSKHPLAGLVSRRNSEISMFTGGPYAGLPSQTVSNSTPLAQANAPVASLPALVSGLPSVESLQIPTKATRSQVAQLQMEPVRNDSIRIAQSLPSLFIDPSVVQ
jgi:GH24 family phage-related lysozyme (muramidase)